MVHMIHVKFYNGVFAYERLASIEKNVSGLNTVSIFVFSLPSRLQRQQKVREFIIKYG